MSITKKITPIDSYDKSKFKKVIQLKTKLPIKNDNSDLLIYLIYINYLNKLIISGNNEDDDDNLDELNEIKLKKKHQLLMKKFGG